MPELEDAWLGLLDQLEEAGFDRERLARPATAERLVSEEARFGRALHPSLLSLYRLADGTRDAFPPSGRPDETELFAGVRFLPVDLAVDAAIGLREAASQPGMPEGLWSEAWFPVFEMWADHVIAVDMETGAVWFVWWEDTRIHQVAADLAEFLGQWAGIVEKSRARFDPSTNEWVLPRAFSGDTVPSRPLTGRGREEITGLPHPLAYPPAPRTDRSMGDAFSDLLDVHRTFGSPVPDLLRPPVSHERLRSAEQALGFDLHNDVRTLFEFADGIDSHPFDRLPQILPTLTFPGLDASLDAHGKFDETSVDFVNRRRWWGQSWLPVFLFGHLNAVTVDCESGQVWSVYWSAGQVGHPSNPLDVRPIAPNLASYIVQASRILSRAPVAFHREMGRFKYLKGAGPSFV